MAAGLGFKTFTTGEVLTAGDVNGYLMQGVLVFATAAARNSAITSPQEGQFAFTKDTNGLWYYDGAAWVASGATGDIEGVTAGVGITGGGTSGTVTVTNDMATTITTAGDLIKGTGSGTYNRLGIGSTGQVLTVASGAPSWATPASGITLITRQTFSSVADTGTTFDGFATSTYKSYLMIIEDIISSSASSDLRCQFRVGATTQNGANYYGATFGYNLNATLLTVGENGSTSFRIGVLSTSVLSSSSVTFMGLGQSQNPRCTGTFYDGARNLAGVVGDRYLDTITANGIILSASAGNITGTVAIYGLASA